MKLIFVNQSRQHRQPRKYLSQWLKHVEKNLPRYGVREKLSRKELTLVFLDTGPARRLNRQYRRKNYATDVLSFVASDPDSLGELVLCPQVIARQAREHGLSFRQELAYLVLHGLLHLLGFEHETDRKSAARMFHVQDNLFSQIDKIR